MPPASQPDAAISRLPARSVRLHDRGHFAANVVEVPFRNLAELGEGGDMLEFLAQLFAGKRWLTPLVTNARCFLGRCAMMLCNAA